MDQGNSKIIKKLQNYRKFKTESQSHLIYIYICIYIFSCIYLCLYYACAYCTYIIYVYMYIYIIYIYIYICIHYTNMCHI